MTIGALSSPTGAGEPKQGGHEDDQQIHPTFVSSLHNLSRFVERVCIAYTPVIYSGVVMPGAWSCSGGSRS
jgi:hypothetical protein